MTLKAQGLNVSKLCCVCRTPPATDTDTSWRHIFTDSDDEHSLLTIIEEITGRVVRPVEGFPERLCPNCWTEAKVAFNFKRRFEMSLQTTHQNKRKSKLPNESVTKEIKLDTINGERCSTCLHFESFKESVTRDLGSIGRKLDFIIETLAEQKVISGQLVLQGASQGAIRSRFPLKTEEEISQVDMEIELTDRDEYIKTMMFLLEPDGVVKNIKNIITDELTVQFNVDGIKGKKSLKDYANFYASLMHSIKEPNADKALRQAMQRQKKRFFKRKCTLAVLNNSISDKLGNTE